MMYMAPFAAHLLISGNGSRIWKASRFPSSLCGSRGFHESLAGGEEGKAYGDYNLAAQSMCKSLCIH